MLRTSQDSKGGASEADSLSSIFSGNQQEDSNTESQGADQSTAATPKHDEPSGIDSEIVQKEIDSYEGIANGSIDKPFEALNKPGAQEDPSNQTSKVGMVGDNGSFQESVQAKASGAGKNTLLHEDSNQSAEEQLPSNEANPSRSDSESEDPSVEEPEESGDARGPSNPSGLHDTSDMFLIDNLVTSTLGLNPPKRPEPEPELSMDALMNLPLGPGSVQTQAEDGLETDDGDSASSSDSDSDSSEGLIHKKEETIVSEDHQEVVLNEAIDSRKSSVEEVNAKGTIQESEEANVGATSRETEEAVEPDEVFLPEDSEQMPYEEEQSNVTRSEVVLDSENDIEKWIRENTAEIMYDPQQHGSMFGDQESSSDGNSVEEEQAITQDGAVSDEGSGEKDQAEMIKRALCKAVDDGASPAKLKSIIDALNSSKRSVSGRPALGGKKSTSKSNIRRNTREDYGGDAPHKQSKQRTGLEASIVPVETDDLEVVLENRPTLAEDWNGMFGSPFYEKPENAGSSIPEEQPLEDESNQTENPPRIERHDKEGEMSVDDLAAVAKRRGLSLETLMKDAEKRGIKLRE